MKKIPKRAQLNDQAPIVVKIDPLELKSGIVVPKVKYEVTATLEEEEVFNGMVLPLPKVLVYYLTHNELLIVSLIIEESNKCGECMLTVKEIAGMLRISIPTVSNCLYSLRKAGLLLESPNGKRGAGRTRKLNYKTIQHLNDLVEGNDPSVFVRIRKATRKKDIMNMTNDDVMNAYDNIALEPDHDPAEEEEYD